MYEEGLKDLVMHSINYTDAGPKSLTIIPERVLEGIAYGNLYEFHGDPLAELVSNPDYSLEEVTISMSFVNDLIELKVLREATVDGIDIHNCFPMFIMPK